MKFTFDEYVGSVQIQYLQDEVCHLIMSLDSPMDDSTGDFECRIPMNFVGGDFPAYSLIIGSYEATKGESRFMECNAVNY